RDEADRSVLHIGPMAQDWQRAFGFSRDGTTINMSDFDGVNLAAVKALETRTAQQAERIRTLEARNAEQAEQIRTLDARLAELRQMVQALTAAQPKP
ncbi:MAG: hypothetical protein ACJ8GN_22595, partial [Longimicrobiaceae bacterium]